MSKLPSPHDEMGTVSETLEATHARTESWDKKAARSPKQILQPILDNEALRFGNSPRARVEQNILSMVNPMETEAEIAILKAIEEDERDAGRLNPAAVVFPSLSQEGTETFQAHLQEHVREAPSAEDPNENECTRPVASKDIALQRPPPVRHRTATSGSKAPREDHDTGGGGVDSTLFGLTNIMRDIHQNADEDHAADLPEKGRRRLASYDLGQSGANIGSSEPQSSTDALVATAALLFRGKLNKPTEVSPTTTTTNNDADPKKNDDMIIVEGDEDDEKNEDDLEAGLAGKGGGNGRTSSLRNTLSAQSMYHSAMNAAKDEWDLFNGFLVEKKRSMLVYAKYVLLFVFLPVLAISALLFYLLDNPLMKLTGASVSWFLLFIGIRQIITFSFAKLTEMLIVDFLGLKTRFLMSLFGPWLTLMIVGSKGWPCTLTWWAIYDLIMLAGSDPFPNHWFFYQNAIGLFNADNPSGNITDHPFNYKILIAALIVGLIVGVKRFVVGLYIGGRTYKNYGTKLATVVHKMIIIAQVAALARRLERSHAVAMGTHALKRKNTTSSRNEPMYASWESFRGFDGAGLKYEDENEDIVDGNLPETDADSSDGNDATENPNLIDSTHRENFTKSLNPSERFKISLLLDRWEEPPEEQRVGKVSIGSILQFKQALQFMDLTYPFSRVFGLANNRENCVQSAQELYGLLLYGNPDPRAADAYTVLQFETLAELARRPDGELDEARVKDLVRVFRPDRDGKLETMDFLRSVDEVYKDLRLLRASISNSGQIDRAFESIINVAFYFAVGCAVLAAWGIDPLALFLSLSSFILAFSFMVGSASAKYFEGLMFILGRTPYDIGDRISINGPDELPNTDGVATWFVENVTLYYTTIRLGATNEVATIANSSLASARIVNAARSPRANTHITLKFGIDTPYAKIELFKQTIQSFVKARPREWLNCSGIRTNQVMAELGYIEIKINLQHRDSWQNIGNIIESKAAVIGYCLEVQKLLGIKYKQPATPIDLTLKNQGALANAFSPQVVDGSVPGFDPGAGTMDSHNNSELGALRNRTQSEDLRNITAMFST